MQMSMNEKKLFLFTSQLRTVACKKKKKKVEVWFTLQFTPIYIYIYIFLQDKTFKQERKYDSSTVILNNITGYVRARSSS